ASSGATVPLTGFGYLLAEGVKKAVDEQGLLGCLTGGLTASAAGVTASIVFALIWAAIFKSKSK
ncbi:MAG: SpoVA/SpoVAEb family sporulation membrane protein, partial [Clostridia bacterium]